MANWPPFQISNVFIFASGGVGANGSYGYASVSKPSTGVYEVVLPRDITGAQQPRTVSYVQLQNTDTSDDRVSAIRLLTGTPYTLTYTIRNAAGTPIDRQHTLKVTWS